MAELPVDAVVFDLGGVLIDWDPRYLYRQLFADPAEMESFLARICTSDWHRAHDLGEDTNQSCRRLARLHPGQAEMIMAWAERGEEMVAGQFDPAVAVLGELRAAGIRCYALSNMEPDLFAIRRARFPFMEWFDGHVISGLEGMAKPDPADLRGPAQAASPGAAGHGIHRRHARQRRDGPRARHRRAALHLGGPTQAGSARP